MFQAANSKHPELISTYAEPMSWDQRLREAFEEKGWKKAELARRSGVSYDNINKYLAGQVKQPRGDIMDKLARALNLDPLYLARGVDPATGSTSVPVMGLVGAGAEVEPDFEQIPPEGLEQVSVPFALPEDMWAFRVVGDSMLPQYRSDTLIIVYREQRRALDTFYGEEAVVRTHDGRRFIKTLMRGDRGVNLVSWNAKPIENAQIEWIGEIFAALNPAALRRTVKQQGIQGQLHLRTG